MKIKHDNKDEVHLEFSSVLDIKRWLDENEHIVTNRYDSHENSFSFTGTENWDEFIGIVDNGSDEIIDNIKIQSHKFADNLTDKYEITKDYKFDVYGQFFDVGMVLSGEPESWVNPIEDDVKKQIEISVNASYLNNIEHDTVIENASRIVGMILSLEKMGVETKLLLNFRSNEIYSGNGKKVFMVSLVAKEYEQGVDYKKLSSLLHTSMFRRGVFRMREVVVGNKMDSYGTTSPLETDTLIYRSSSIDKLERKLFGGIK